MINLSEEDFFRIIRDRKLDVLMDVHPIRGEDSDILAMDCHVKFRDGRLFGKMVSFPLRYGGNEAYYIDESYSSWI